MTLVISVACWVIGFLLILGYVVLDLRTGFLGLYVSGLGGVMTMRGFLLDLKDREFNAFAIGRDWSDVESLRSVGRD